MKSTAVLKMDVTVWFRTGEEAWYAFPLGQVDTPWAAEDTVYPAIDDVDWHFKGTWPAGLEVGQVEQVAGHKVRCTIAGKMLYTADWAITTHIGM